MLFIRNTSQQADRTNEKVRFFTLFSLIFFVIKLCVVSLLSYLILMRFSVLSISDSFQSYLLVLAATFCFFMLHSCIRYFISFVFDYQGYVTVNSAWNAYYNNLIIWLLPILLIVVYNHHLYEWLTYLLITCAVTLLLLRLIMIFSCHKKEISNAIPYFILYLCIFEIIPILFMVKLGFK